jgi:hypothetical protein
MHRLAQMTAAAALSLVVGCAMLGPQAKPPSDDSNRPIGSQAVLTPPPPPPLPPRPAVGKIPAGKPVVVEDKHIHGQAITVVKVDLRRVEPHFSFAYGTGKPLRKVESFQAMWRRSAPYVVASGTFFGVRNRETMGTIVTGGRIKQSPDWDNRGSALVIDHTGKAEMRTLRLERKPNPRMTRFWLQAGPRLLKDKKVWYHPKVEGFRDPSLFSRARRMCVGIAGNGHTMVFVGFKEYPSLLETAQILRDLGLSDAMNLDGGPSAGLAVGNRVIMAPDSRLTHVLVMKPRFGAVTATARRPAAKPSPVVERQAKVRPALLEAAP